MVSIFRWFIFVISDIPNSDIESINEAQAEARPCFRHFKFIGECFVETLMHGWIAPVIEDGNKMVFVIH